MAYLHRIKGVEAWVVVSAKVVVFGVHDFSCHSSEGFEKGEWVWVCRVCLGK